MRAAQRAQAKGMNITAEKYFREAELYNTRAEKLDLQGQGMSNPPKFGQYTLPGGENYREILLTMPQKPQPLPEGFNVDAYSVNGVTKYGVYDASGQRYGSGATKDEALKRFSEMHQDKPYKSSHWDQPNVLAHMRVNDRIDADGKKMLLIEEVQSDWHQAGRTKGYRTNAKADLPEGSKVFAPGAPDSPGQTNQAYTVQIPRAVNGRSLFYGTTEEEALANARSFIAQPSQSAVPDAPFKDTWYQLALKRAIKHAADNGYDRVGLTTGKRQAERYDLSKQVNKIDVEAVEEVPNLYFVDVDVAGGKRMNLEVENGIVRNDEFRGKPLRDVVGKEMSDKILSVKQGNMQRFEGGDLSIGGEGMKKYYDEIYPKFLDKYAKKWGAKVGETSISTERSRDASGIPSMYPQQEPIRYIDITPEMKASVSKGQPLFTAAPAIPAMSFGDLFNEPSDSQKELSFSDLFKAK